MKIAFAIESDLNIKNEFTGAGENVHTVTQLSGMFCFKYHVTKFYSGAD